MNQSTKYKSIQELKSSSKPADPSSIKSMERHDRFERSMRSLRQEYVKQLKRVNESNQTNIQMKKYLLASIIFLASLHISFGQGIDNSYAKAEAEINSVYQKILREYAADKEFIKNLRASQRLWIQFRDAEVKAKYPDREPGYYGSVHSMCLANLKAELTNERIKTLKVWLVGIEEGDVCAGSVKQKP